MDKKVFDDGVDYRKMYYHMARAMEQAIRILIVAQQECEDIMLDCSESSESEEVPDDCQKESDSY